MSDQIPDLVGRTLGNWSLTRLLGEGGFGAVYEAQHTQIAGRRAAVKVLHRHYAFQEDIKRRFITEASIASQADHENIVQVFDGGISEDGTCYVAMELLQGHSLADLLHREKQLGVERTLEIAIQVANALEAAHSIGVVHRDLKPDNVFVSSRRGNATAVKVLDFGIAKLHSQKSQTQSGALLGTPRYMSPEQWQGIRDIDFRADLYALGLILYECLVGRPAFNEDTSVALMMAHMQKEVPDPGQLVSMPDGLSRLILGLLSKERDARPSSTSLVIAELRRIAGLPPLPRPLLSPRALRRWGVLALGCSLLIAMSAAALKKGWPGRRPQSLAANDSVTPPSAAPVFAAPSPTPPLPNVREDMMPAEPGRAEAALRPPVPVVAAPVVRPAGRPKPAVAAPPLEAKKPAPPSPNKTADPYGVPIVR